MISGIFFLLKLFSYPFNLSLCTQLITNDFLNKYEEKKNNSKNEMIFITKNKTKLKITRVENKSSSNEGVGLMNAIHRRIVCLAKKPPPHFVRNYYDHIHTKNIVIANHFHVVKRFTLYHRIFVNIGTFINSLTLR